jgi:hypothetical protein
MIMSVDPALPRARRKDWAEMKARISYGMTFMNHGALVDAMNGAARPTTYEIKEYGNEVMQAVSELNGFRKDM